VLVEAGDDVVDVIGWEVLVEVEDDAVDVVG